MPVRACPSRPIAMLAAELFCIIRHFLKPLAAATVVLDAVLIVGVVVTVLPAYAVINHLINWGDYSPLKAM
jgi:hypothetical protein